MRAHPLERVECYVPLPVVPRLPSAVVVGVRTRLMVGL
jgi:hypothetical protein